ncbi:RHS repeat-associated core domain-containing protein [Moraxella cuniculi DSM 21768]|uniref:RHS repeat-associated core domain-containing protein n=1 Tax=Moraxella cuniculi DSM 21768 TaxID=1122245 RepID=A0A1N7G147_9GAMM|nr:hypothetical protein B0189_02005 [Moraxella cuniculi]SIS06319.1 RHS repeat-associated core domain-containing protein [Moraxella cuniculi DSM 21768]
MFIQRDPIGLLGGVNVFAYAPNPVGWVDPWGLAKKKKDVIVYRALSADDRIRYDQGLDLEPKGDSGCILSHVQGKNTKLISAAETKGATDRFDSGHGVAEINATLAQELGSGFIAHKNVLQATKRDTKAHANAKIAEEVLFSNGIPYGAIIKVD